VAFGYSLAFGTDAHGLGLIGTFGQARPASPSAS
jgi:hypothetical protein